MTMTPERIAELDAVMAKMSEPRPTKIEHKYTISDWCGRIEYAKYALADAYPDMRAHIDAQAATIEKLLMAIRSAVDDFQLVVERIDDNQIDRAKGTAMAGERAATRTVLTATGAA